MISRPAYLREMVRRSPPAKTRVIDGSTPVVAFGDPERAAIATLGINPAMDEFLEKGSLRSDGPNRSKGNRRLATLPSLGAASLADLSDDQVDTVLDECCTYFQPHRNPNGRWFNVLDGILKDGLQASYYDGSACHLDLSQWATNPNWSGLDRSEQVALIEDGRRHLRSQLNAKRYRLVVINGREVKDRTEEAGLVKLYEVAVKPFGDGECKFFLGESLGTVWTGWSTNLQSSWGVTNELKASCVAWLEDLNAKLKPAQPA